MPGVDLPCHVHDVIPLRSFVTPEHVRIEHGAHPEQLRGQRRAGKIVHEDPVRAADQVIRISCWRFHRRATGSIFLAVVFRWGAVLRQFQMMLLVLRVHDKRRQRRTSVR